MAVFRYNADQYTSMDFRVDDNGKMFVQAIAHGALTAGSMYLVIPYSYGLKTKAVASGTTLCMAGFAERTYATGDIASIQVGGQADAVTTSALTVSVDQHYGLTSGTFASIGSFTAAVFAVGQTAATSATSNDFILIPRWVTPT